MKINTNLVLILLVIGLIIAAGFYWFQYRPSQIRKECVVTATDNAVEKYDYDGKYQKDDYNFYFEQCLNQEGLK